MKIRILLADDHKILREGLKALLDKEPNLEIVGEAEDGRSTVRLAKELAPDVIIMDISMPLLNGIEAAHQIMTENSNIKIIALSMFGDQPFVKGMLQAGAMGYILKHSASRELLKAIHDVVAGRVFLSSAIAGVVVKDYKRPVPKNSAFTILTSREREILQLFAEGKKPREIAELLCLGVKTVEAYRRQIMNKIGLTSFADLVKYAIREGLTSLDL
jgi:two-component system, NarL family, response regulator NreC